MKYSVFDTVTSDTVATGLSVAQATRDALSRAGARYELRPAKSAGWELWIANGPRESLSYYLYSPEPSEDAALTDMALNWIDWSKHRHAIVSDEGFAAS